MSALCLLYAQRRLLTAAAEASVPAAALAALAWPRSLHLGWLLAAALVNLNAWVGKLALTLTLTLTLTRTLTLTLTLTR